MELALPRDEESSETITEPLDQGAFELFVFLSSVC